MYVVQLKYKTIENVNSNTEVKKSVSERKETFDVGGLSCSSCTNTVQRTVSRLEGVKSADVNFSASSATVEYDPRVVNPGQMQEAVAKVGYNLNTKGSGK